MSDQPATDANAEYRERIASAKPDVIPRRTFTPVNHLKTLQQGLGGPLDQLGEYQIVQ